jgi:hypothetical protein
MAFQSQPAKFSWRSLCFSASVLVTTSLLASPLNAAPNPSLRLAQANPRQPDDSRNVPRFECQLDNGEYTVMYNPVSQPGRSYPWAVPSTMGGGWSAQRRCDTISDRLESYRPDGLLEMRTGTENGYNILCVTTEANSSCRIVLTVPDGEDPIAIRDRVFSNLTIADSGEQTSGVATFAGGDSGLMNEVSEAVGVDLSPVFEGNRRSRSSSTTLNLRPFLDEADGGTGTQLR